MWRMLGIFCEVILLVWFYGGIDDFFVYVFWDGDVKFFIDGLEGVIVVIFEFEFVIICNIEVVIFDV